MNSKNSSSYFVLVISFFIMITCIGGIPSKFSLLIDVAYILSAIFCFLNKSNTNPLLFLYCLYLCITIIIGNPDPAFRSWERLAVFVLMFASASPLFQSDKIRFLRKQIFNTCIIACIIISIMSFFCYFLNINLFVDKYEGGYFLDYLENIGHFSGVTKHSMILGPIAGLASISLLQDALTNQKKFLWILLAIAVGSLFFSASRGAIISAIAAYMVFFIPFLSRESNKIKYLFVLLLSLIILYPFYRPYVESALNKHKTVQLGMYDSRSGKVEARLMEFANNPITGVGFASIDPDGIDTYNKDTGSIEPGSSWLAILSMTGIIGLILFLYILIPSYRATKSIGDYRMLSFLSFFVVHMLVEGYVFSAGNAITFLFWLSLGICYDTQFEAYLITDDIE